MFINVKMIFEKKNTYLNDTLKYDKLFLFKWSTTGKRGDKVTVMKHESWAETTQAWKISVAKAHFQPNILFHQKKEKKKEGHLQHCMYSVRLKEYCL